jgi:hypothetical protein
VAPANSSDERHTPANYGLRELRRRTATNGNGTSVERGVLEREANSSRQEWEALLPFIESRRERRGRWFFMDHQWCSSLGELMGKGTDEIKLHDARFQTGVRY